MPASERVLQRTRLRQRHLLQCVRDPRCSVRDVLESMLLGSRVRTDHAALCRGVHAQVLDVSEHERVLHRSQLRTDHARRMRLHVPGPLVQHGCPVLHRLLPALGPALRVRTDRPFMRDDEPVLLGLRMQPGAVPAADLPVSALGMRRWNRLLRRRLRQRDLLHGERARVQHSIRLLLQRPVLRCHAMRAVPRSGRRVRWRPQLEGLLFAVQLSQRLDVLLPTGGAMHHGQRLLRQRPLQLGECVLQHGWHRLCGQHRLLLGQLLAWHQ